MIFIIGARATGKSTMLYKMMENNPKALLVSSKPSTKAKARICPNYALESILRYGQVLEQGCKLSDYELYFDEPSDYWHTFLQILALADPGLLKAAAFTPSTEAQSTLKQINPCLVDRVLRMTWEDLPKCQKC